MEDELHLGLSARAGINKPEPGIIDLMDQNLETVRKAEQAEPETYFWADIKKVQEPLWLVGDLVPKNQITLLTGSPKVGKTTFVGCMLAAGMYNQLFLNQPTYNFRTMLLSDEGLLTLKKWGERCGFPDEDRGEDLSLCQIEFALNSQRENKNFLQICDWLNDKHYRNPVDLYIFDSMISWFSMQDDNSYAEGAKMMQTVQKLRDSTGAAIYLLHHTVKSAGNDIIRNALGSTAYSAQVDMILELGPKPKSDNVMQLQRKGRIAEEKTNYFTYTNGLCVPWQEKADTQDKQNLLLTESIMPWLEQQDAPVSITDIAMGVEINLRKVRPAIDEGIEQGIIIREGKGKTIRYSSAG